MYQVAGRINGKPIKVHAFAINFGRGHELAIIYSPSFPRISRAAVAMTVPGPYTPATPAS